MHWRNAFLVLTLPLAILQPQPLVAAEQSAEQSSSMQEVLVEESRDAVSLPHDATSTAATIPAETISKVAGPAQSNPMKALDLLPSVHTEGVDAFGLVNAQNNLRIRGQYGDTFTRLSRTIMGMPIGINTGQLSAGNFLDLENVGSISSGRGPIPSDQGFGFGNTAGTLDQQFAEPAAEPGLDLKGSVGSEDFGRFFGRADTGAWNHTGTQAFISGSHAEADNWRGAGSTDRSNGMMGFKQNISDLVTMQVYTIYNQYQQDEYQPLTYAQTKDKSQYGNIGYGDTVTRNAALDKYLSKFNTQDAEEWTVFANIEFKPNSDITVTLKPYWYQVNGERFSSSANNNSINWSEIDTQQGGFISEYAQKVDHGLGRTEVKVGNWFQDIHSLPPPNASKTYSITNGQLVFNSWNMLTETEDRIFESPYIMTRTTIDQLHVDLGYKHIFVRIPGVQGYTIGNYNLNYDDAIDRATANPSLQADGFWRNEWLPFAGLGYDLNNETNVRLSYGRNYAGTWQGPLYSTYASPSNNYYQMRQFQALGINLQDLMESQELETSHNIDLGLRYDDGVYAVAPTLFWATFNNKQVLASDSRVLNAPGGQPVSYYVSNGEAESYGAELEASVKPLPELKVFASGSYDSFKYTDNIQLPQSNVSTIVDGNDVADAPRWLAKLGTTYTWQDLSVTPLYRYVGSRYGDAQNTQKIGAYSVADIYTEYALHDLGKLKDATIGLSFLNVTDAKYIGIIKNDQDSSGSTSVTYYPGAPFTAVATFGVKF